MKLYSKKILIASIVMGILPLLFVFPSFGGAILDGYPSGTGLTGNTVMRIDLDSPVAMIGNQPDMTYCVKKLVSFSISGFDYIINNADVPCDVAASDDRKSVTLYPSRFWTPVPSMLIELKILIFREAVLPGISANATQPGIIPLYLLLIPHQKQTCARTIIMNMVTTFW